MNNKESSSFTVWIHRILDVTFPICALYLVATLYPPVIWSEKYQVLSLLGGLLLVIFNQSTGAYSHWHERALLSGFKLVLKAWAFTWLALLMLAFLFQDSSSFSRIALSSWAVITPFFLLLYRVILRSLFGKFRIQGWNTKSVAILGCGELGQRLAASLINAKMLGYIPLHFYDDDLTLTGKSFHGVPVSGSIDHFLSTEGIEDIFDEIYIALPLRSEKRIEQILNTLSDNTLTVSFIPDCFTFDLLHSHISDIGGLPIISVYDTPLINSTNKLLKRVEDIILSILILTIISPLFIFIAMGVKLSSKGSVFYKQQRMGWNANQFTMYKFRSQPVDTGNHEITGGSAKSNFGTFLRKTGLDKLPQFFNVLKGDMSIVGPRPEREIFDEEFRKQVPRYMQKHMVKAGITGWAQINGWRGDTSIDTRIQFDLYYIENWSLWLDMKIIFLTIIKRVINKNAY